MVLVSTEKLIQVLLLLELSQWVGIEQRSTVAQHHRRCTRPRVYQRSKRVHKQRRDDR